MKLAQIQMHVTADKAANLRHAEDLLRSVRGADMAILPWVRNINGFYEAGELVGFKDFKHLGRALERFLKRPAVQRGLLIPAAPVV